MATRRWRGSRPIRGCAISGDHDLGAGRDSTASCAASSSGPRTICRSPSTRCCCARASAPRLDNKRLRDGERRIWPRSRHSGASSMLPYARFSQHRPSRSCSPPAGLHLDDLRRSAVMLADVVGFTHYCDRHRPEEVVAEFHRFACRLRGPGRGAWAGEDQRHRRRRLAHRPTCCARTPNR